MADLYADRMVRCTDDAVRIRGYYFPWGTKVIPYGSITGLTRVAMGPATGRGRVWGTANPRYWAGLDVARPRKKVAFVLDVGKFVHPFMTPDDPDAFEAVVRSHATVTPTNGGAPLI